MSETISFISDMNQKEKLIDDCSSMWWLTSSLRHEPRDLKDDDNFGQIIVSASFTQILLLQCHGLSWFNNLLLDEMHNLNDDKSDPWATT